MELVLLGAALVGCLLLIPFALPGTWLMIGAAAVFQLVVSPARIGAITFVVVVALAVAGEALDIVFMSRYAKKYGGSARAAWGAVIGGVVGALVGVPVPVVGSLVGAFAGAFAGAMLLELAGRRSHGEAARAATGAVIGRAVASAAKVMVGCVMAALILASAWT
ncbi:MAG: DUF456 domain-containing protein [Gemmatimonadetes bacterium]|nr:DUF456 domain-containing protein [Gemmatimonadota bacterium]